MSKERLESDVASKFCESNVLAELKKTTYSIVDLLPQHNSALMRNSKLAFEMLKMVYNITSLLVDCLSKFYILKQYQYFDPHVGDTACQIRAYAFVLLSKKKDNNTVIERICFLNTILGNLTAILCTPINFKNRRHTIVELLKKYECYFSLEWQEYFLYESYFLTLFKEINAKEVYICDNKIAYFFGVSKTPSKKMFYQYQVHLSTLSCEFIKTIALDLNINEKNCPNIVSLILHDDNKRRVYPCFFYSKVLFMHMQKTRCTVLIKLDTIDGSGSRKDLILFDGGSNEGFLLARDNDLIKEDMCVVIIGTRIASLSLSSLELLKCLNHYGLYAILLMNMAAHPQFSGSKLISYANQLAPDTITLVKTEKKIEQEFLALKKSAYENGFCRDNPSLLLIKHIFMDTISNQINLYKNTNDTIRAREPVDI